MRKTILLVCFAVLLSTTFALNVKADDEQIVVWCWSSIDHLTSGEKYELGIHYWGDDPYCICWSETKNYEWVEKGIMPTNLYRNGSWYDIYCHDGLLRQQRTNEHLKAPNCEEIIFEAEYQDIVRDYCEACRAPIVTGAWEQKGCLGGKELLQRTVIAEVAVQIPPGIIRCYKQDFVEYKITDEDCKVEPLTEEQLSEKIKEDSEDNIERHNDVLNAVSFVIGLFIGLGSAMVILLVVWLKWGRKKSAATR